MKTPRDILLERHDHQNSQLDALRATAVASAKARHRPDVARFLHAAWAELFWSCQRAWIGLGAVWLAIIVLNLESRDSNRPAVRQAPPAAEVIATFREQRRLMAELIDQHEAVDAEPPKPAASRPRTEGLIFTATV
jgi:hypothetical protein